MNEFGLNEGIALGSSIFNNALNGILQTTENAITREREDNAVQRRVTVI